MSILTENVPRSLSRLINTVVLLIFLPFLIAAVFQIVRLYTQAVGTPADISVNASIKYHDVNTNFYHAFAQGGEEATDMISPVLTEVTGLKPRVIRIDHVFDHYQVVTGDSSNLQFDFSRLDQVVNTIMATGAVPFLSLSYMPQAIAVDGNVTNPPKSWPDWSLVVQKTIEHYSGKSNLNLKDIYYEVWNEPDLEQFGGWKIYGEKNYLNLYQYAVTGALQADNVNNFNIGGPAISGLYKNWITALIESGYRLDFISWHTYDDDPRKFTDDQRNIVLWLLKYPNYLNIPKIISEFGFNSQKDIRYSSSYAASYTAGVIRQLISNSPKYLMSFQLKDGPDQQDNHGWGIIAHEDQSKTKKPRYYVYNFIDQMDGTLLKISGEGTWVTGLASAKDTTIQVLLINYDPKGIHTENVPVNISGVGPGVYTYQIQYLFQNGCSFNIPKLNSDLPHVTVENNFQINICMSAQNLAILKLTKTP